MSKVHIIQSYIEQVQLLLFQVGLLHVPDSTLCHKGEFPGCFLATLSPVFCIDKVCVCLCVCMHMCVCLCLCLCVCVQLAHALEPFNLKWIEECLPPNDYSGQPQ